MEACAEAEQNREGFWKEKLKNVTQKKQKTFWTDKKFFFFFLKLVWDKEPEIIYRENPETQFGYEWFADGKLNMSYNCLDR